MAKPTVPFFVVEYVRRIHSGREIVEVRVVNRSVFAADFDEIWAHNLREGDCSASRQKHNLFAEWQWMDMPKDRATKDWWTNQVQV